MKKSLKLVGIFMVVVIVGIVGGLSIYFLIANNKTYYIYDLRIVEPVQGQGYYVYTDSEAEYTSMKNKVVNMTCDEENILEIGIYAYTSTNTNQVNVYSSNTGVAEIRINNGHMYVVYRGAGEAVITAQIGSVTDTMRVIVYNNPAEVLDVFDDSYYGEEYATKYFANEIVLYADGEEYEYRFETSRLQNSQYSDDINSELLMIDYEEINRDVFLDENDISIDAKNKKLVLKCNPETTEETTDITIISYTRNANGEIRTESKKRFVVRVRIITYTPQFLQLVVSKNPNFEDNYVFMSTVQDDVSKYTEDQIKANKSILDKFLEYQIAETELSVNGEFSTYKMLFSGNVGKVYFKVRKVYTNGDIVYLNPKTRAEHGYTLSPNENADEYLKISSDGSYYILSLTEDYFTSGHDSYDLTVTIDGGLSHVFKFEYAELNERASIEQYYSFDEDTGIYTYTYWDPRSHFENEMYNENGEVVGFGE